MSHQTTRQKRMNNQTDLIFPIRFFTNNIHDLHHSELSYRLEKTTDYGQYPLSTGGVDYLITYLTHPFAIDPSSKAQGNNTSSQFLLAGFQFRGRVKPGRSKRVACSVFGVVIFNNGNCPMLFLF